MHRVVSPNDVFFSYEPWSAVRQVDVQNSLLNDPPTAYFTLMSLLKHDWRAFHWNPFVASGIPGFGSSASAVLSPFIFLPALLLPPAWIYTGIIFLKLNAAFWFTYLWLREERLGKGAAAVGAIIFAASGAIAVRWLWQATNATAFYPALLWIVRRIAHRKRTPFWAMALIALFYALAGFPAAMAYGGPVLKEACDQLGLDPSTTLVTDLDSDFRLHPQYFAYITAEYCGMPIAEITALLRKIRPKSSSSGKISSCSGKNTPAESTR